MGFSKHGIDRENIRKLTYDYKNITEARKENFFVLSTFRICLKIGVIQEVMGNGGYHHFEGMF